RDAPESSFAGWSRKRRSARDDVEMTVIAAASMIAALFSRGVALIDIGVKDGAIYRSADLYEALGIRQ
ncbi:MAG: hypothetical protein M3037_09905, partial [Gemmatimonadota bacterium]|nr:hypothetical protein [Gemmatimonadota bacterium]